MGIPATDVDQNYLSQLHQTQLMKTLLSSLFAVLCAGLTTLAPLTGHAQGNLPGQVDVSFDAGEGLSWPDGIIRALVESGQVKRERIVESFDRIMKLKLGIGSTTEENLRRELNAAKVEVETLKKAKVESKEIEKPSGAVPAVNPTEEDGKMKKKKKS